MSAKRSILSYLSADSVKCRNSAKVNLVIGFLARFLGPVGLQIAGSNEVGQKLSKIVLFSLLRLMDERLDVTGMV